MRYICRKLSFSYILLDSVAVSVIFAYFWSIKYNRNILEHGVKFIKKIHKTLNSPSFYKNIKTVMFIRTKTKRSTRIMSCLCNKTSISILVHTTRFLITFTTHAHRQKIGTSTNVLYVIRFQ